jgi:hypothetical protein
LSALPPVAPGAIPADVRAEGPKAVRSYESALGFERLLLSKLLTEALPEENEGEGEGEGSEPRAVSMPETLADAISSAGGTGIAADLYRSTGGGPTGSEA